MDSKKVDNNKIKVSVLLPSLNVAEYIDYTLRSAFVQSMYKSGELEIICIDAGSSDGTLEIIEKYKDYDNFRLINSDLRSYGHQLNLGIAEAHGLYIGILETDDVAAPDMYESLYKLASENDADIAKSTYFDYFGEREGEIKVAKSLSIKGSARVSLLAAIKAPAKVFKAEECPELLLHHPSVWSAIYKKSWLSEKNISFPEIPGAGWADNPFFIESFIKADKIAYTPKAYYYYRKDNAGSSTALKNCRMPMERIAEMRDVARAAGAADVVMQAIDHRALRYAADAFASPNFDVAKDGQIIRDTLSSISEEYVQSDEHVTPDELAAYNRALDKKLNETVSHKMRVLAYKLKYGAQYIINTKLS